MTLVRTPSTPTRDRVDAQRRGLYAKISIARKDLGVEEDSYRDLLAARYGHRSATKLSLGDLEDLIDYFKDQGWKPVSKAPARAGSRKMARTGEARKARAVWISLYHLGVVKDPSEAALAAFVERQSGVQALEWVKNWHPIIEALKGWAERDGGVIWEPYRPHGPKGPYSLDKPRCRVIEAQWQILVTANQAAHWGLNGYACRIVGYHNDNTILSFSDAECDRVIEALGSKVRDVKARSS